MQIEALAGFSAIIDRLGEFSEVVESFASPDGAADASGNGSSPPRRIELVDVPTATQHSPAGQPLLRLEGVTLQIPDGSRTLVDSLDVEVGFPLLSVVIYPILDRERLWRVISRSLPNKLSVEASLTQSLWKLKAQTIAL